MTTAPQSRQRAFRFDQRYCIACKACVIACKDKHDLPVGVNWRRVATVERGAFPRPRAFHLSISCNHCGDPACVAACPTGALRKRTEDGVVALAAEECIACGACVPACPWGAIQRDPNTDAVGKCDFCRDLLAAGREPACVSACVMRVLTCGWLDEMADLPEPTGPGLPDPAGLAPALRIVPHRDAHERAGQSTQRRQEDEEAKLAKRLRAFDYFAPLR
jgi:anaerobic dimethyl sulfoxide reductase subunit B